MRRGKNKILLCRNSSSLGNNLKCVRIMKKIMFSDKNGLTAAVLAGTKTQTRRIIEAMPKEPRIAYGLEEEAGYVFLLDGYTVVAKSRFKIEEVVAVAQPYKYFDGKSDKYMNEWCKIVACNGMNSAGYNNKMFVSADLMPHKIKITDIRVQRLQDISEEDCIAEGIMRFPDGFTGDIVYSFQGCGYNFDYPITAYSELIDSISGKGTWERNPWAFCYTFKLVK